MEGGPNKTTFDLFLEKFAPGLGYMMIVFPVVMSFIEPDIAGIYIIIVAMYFFYKSLSSTITFALGLRRIHENEQVDWNKLVMGLEDVDAEIANLDTQISNISELTWEAYDEEDKKDGIDDIAAGLYKSKTSRLPELYKKAYFKLEKRKAIRYFKNQKDTLLKAKSRLSMKPSEIQHIIIIPFVAEPIDLLRQSIDCLKKQTFNTKQISIVLAAEAGIEGSDVVANQLKEEYKEYFNQIWVTRHVLAPPDIVGKSANMNWASRKVIVEVEKLGWDLRKTTISSCDSDSKIDPQYFANVTYKYLTTKDFEYKLYTGALVFYNNIWRLPFYARVKNSFSSIYNVSKLPRTDKLVPVSTYTFSYWMAKEIDFWTPWVTPEDYHIFFKCLFKFDDKVESVPIYLKIMSDAAEGDGHIDTMKNNYKQSRRWAWGISDTGWMMKQFLQNFFKHSLRTKYKTLHVIFDHISGPNLALLILIGGNLPVLLNPGFSDEVFGALLPSVTQTIIRVTIIFLIIIIALDFYLKPRPEPYPWWMRITRLLEWLVQPFAGFFLAALPGMESQTRLIFGQYMEYYVTRKKAGTDGEEEEDEE